MTPRRRGLPDASAHDAPRAARMQDVARAAGVSLVTVSRAINTPDKVAPATLAAVRAAIESLRFVPNLNAGSLAANRSRIVGAIVPTIANSIFSETVDGLSQVLRASGYQLLLGQTQYDASEELALVQAFVGRRVDGLVLTGTAHARGVRALLERAGIPVVETWDLAGRPIDMRVGFSNRRAGEAAAGYLIDRGYRRFAFIGGGDDRSATRLAGFAAVCADRGIDPPVQRTLPAPAGLREAAAAMAGLVDAPAPPDAVFCSNDMLAAGALFECRRRGIAVPGRLALMGFADLPIAAAVEPALTTIRVASSEIGQRAGDLLLARLAGRPPAEPVIDVGFAVVPRSST